MPQRVKEFHVYGEGEESTGFESVFAWVKEDTGKKQIEHTVGLTKDEAEWMALIAALEYVGDGSRVLVWVDSPTVADKFNYPVGINNPREQALLTDAQNLESEKALVVEARTIPRSQNLAAQALGAATSKADSRNEESPRRGCDNELMRQQQTKSEH